jgi:phosphatidylglycerophosphate synthase
MEPLSRMTSANAQPTSRPKTAGVRAFVQNAAALRRRCERSQAMLWSRYVNRPLGGLIAQALLRTAVTPNMVSVACAFVTIAGAAIVLVAHGPMAPTAAIAVFVLWEFSLALDNADGFLARARGTSSPFGAWLDQILDFVNHAAVAASLSVFAARALSLRTPVAAILASFVVCGSLISLFASAQRNALLGTDPALTPGSEARLRPLLLGRHLTDFGAFLAIASVGLVWPGFLLVALVVLPACNVASVAGQVMINWSGLRTHGRGSGPDRAGT